MYAMISPSSRQTMNVQATEMPMAADMSLDDGGGVVLRAGKKMKCWN